MNSTEEEQPREERCSCGGVDELGPDQIPDAFLLWWLVLYIEALVLSPNIEREGSQQWRANLKGDSKYQLS